MKLSLILLCLVAATQARFVKRIQDGQDADPTIFTNIVSLHGRERPAERLKFIGSGIIYTSNWVLFSGSTTSQIDVKYPRRLLEVYAGRPDFSKRGPNRQDRNVAEFLTHSSYDPNDLNRSVDLGLVKVDQPFEFNDHVKARYIPSNVVYPSGTAIVAGWGATNPAQLVLALTSEKLKQVEVEIVDKQECELNTVMISKGRNLIISRSYDAESRFCTGSFESPIGPSASDLGSPLMQKNDDDKWEVLGLTFSVPLSNEYMGPSFYISLPYYLGWIQERTGEVQQLH